MIKLRTYRMGKATELAPFEQSAIIELEAPDGRTVQLCFRENGEIDLRGWGNIPISVGNMDCVGFHCKLEYEESDTCVICYNKDEMVIF